jgi:hypothetical protein
MLKKFVAFLLIPASLFLSHQVFAACSSSISPYAEDCDGSGVDWLSGDLTINQGVNLSNTASFDFKSTGSLINNGSISNLNAFDIALILGNGGSLISITSIVNSSTGTIAAPGGQSGVQTFNSVTISSFLNDGTIGTGAEYGFYGQSENTINSFVNNGTLSGSVYGLKMDFDGQIGTLTNSGIIDDIYIDTPDYYGFATIIDTLNNLQGKSTSDILNYDGRVPNNYNIIINSTSDYGQIKFTNISSTTNFGVYSTSSVDTSATYSSVIDGLTSAELNNTTTGTVTLSGTSYTWTLTDADSDLVWDLNFSPSAADTQTSIQAIKGQLQGNLNSLTAGANFANMNTYDCNFFDSKGGCFSFGNRFTDVQSPSMQTNSFVATGGYKIDNHFRIAGFIDQNLNNNTAHNIDIENKGPLVGLIGVWNQNANQLGWQIKVANAYQSKDASIKRSVTGSSEAGSGKTDIDSQSYVAELSYNYAINSSLLLRPYMALRYALVKQEGYTETGVDNPLTYNSIRDRSKTVLVGLKVKKQLTDKVVAKGSVGLENDLSHKTDNLEVSGVSGLTSESFTNKLDKTRPVASVGADYYIDPTQRLSATAFYQELPFASTKARTLYLNYMLAF